METGNRSNSHDTQPYSYMHDGLSSGAEYFKITEECRETFNTIYIRQERWDVISWMLKTQQQRPKVWTRSQISMAKRTSDRHVKQPITVCFVQCLVKGCEKIKVDVPIIIWPACKQLIHSRKSCKFPATMARSLCLHILLKIQYLVDSDTQSLSQL